MRYTIMSPAGYRGRTFVANSDEDAIKIAKDVDGEDVLDITTTMDKSTDWILVVSD